MEIGVSGGESLLLWKEYFRYGDIIGVDTRPCPERDFTVFVGDINSEDIYNKLSDQSFDIIIDDASHTQTSQIISFKLYKSLLRYGGLYIIEDVQSDDVAIALHKTGRFLELDLRSKKGRYDDRLFIYQSPLASVDDLSRQEPV
ncbi:MAG: class I SAM-dependent methyltransferase [Candidatus Cloacimonetes bacterium]|jgi:hypothetical protein|nr:class I SAM-dependent methyltransferase [Candidatus Cloacimonadota bacterium]